MKPAKTDYSLFSGSVIRILNKINFVMKLQKDSDIMEFIGEEYYKSVEIENGSIKNIKNFDEKNNDNNTNLHLVVDPIDFRKILAQKKIINFGEDIDDDFLDFISIGFDQLVDLRKLKNILSDFSK